MYSHRLVFRKAGAARYISHLDLMRTIPRMFLRAGVDVQYTEGFHPHAAISIPLPLPVGFTSDCELLDFSLLSNIPPDTLPPLLNAAAPSGIETVSCTSVIGKPEAPAFVRYAVTLSYDGGVPEGTREALADLLARPSLPVRKKKKPGRGAAAREEIDIRPLYRQAVFQFCPEGLCLTVETAAQNPSLNPSLIVQAVGERLPGAAPDFASFHRLALLNGRGERID